MRGAAEALNDHVMGDYAYNP